MTITEQLRQLLDELDKESAEEALAYLQSRHGDAVVAKGGRIDDVTTPDSDDAAAINAWNDEGGGQALLSEAGADDEVGTEEEQAAAIEAWQLDRRHAVDER